MDDLCKSFLELDVFGVFDIHENTHCLKAERNTDLYWKFADINDFINTKYRLPEECDDLWETSLYYRLKNIQNNKEYCEYLAPYDEFSVLNRGQDIPSTFEEVYANDPFNLLSPYKESSSSIFHLKHIEKRERTQPEYIARRKACADFDLYKDEITAIEEDLKYGRKSAVAFSPDALATGRCYILRGQVFMLVSDSSLNQSFNFKTGSRNRREGRTRCIFSNGTESSLLYRSLVKAMEMDGFCIKETSLETASTTCIQSDDLECGYVYVLRSLSRDPRIRAINNLYKIGFCRGLIEDRIKNAQAEPTYLMGEVHVVLSAKCYNLKTRALENKLHAFFSEANIDIEVIDNHGKAHHPREWFIAPLEIIEQAIKLSLEGEIAKYKYNAKLRVIEKVIS